VARLHAAIREVLSRAVANKGTTLRDFRDAHNEPGENQLWLAAYGRGGEACPRCGQAIVRTVVGSRGTHFCPHCQPAPTAPEEGS
jgi:formamidopyrimidine-DNA glycosylase